MNKALYLFGSIRFKLLGSFLFLILINGISGFFGYENIKVVSHLVNVTYDKALMAATFSQAAKSNFLKMDSTVKSALLASNEKEFKINSIFADDAFETLLEDLDVVEARSLDKSGNKIIKKVKEDLLEVNKERKDLLKRKEDFFKKDNAVIKSAELFSNWDELKVKKVVLRNLTAIHDTAAELGYSFRVESDRKNTETIKRTLLILLLCIVFSVATSLIIAFLIIKPLFKLQKVCLQVNDGDFSIRSNVNRKDEFGDLSRAFDFMLNTIQKKTEDMTTLLAALPIGLFYVDKEGNISQEKSPATEKIFSNFKKFSNLKDFYSESDVSAAQVDQVLAATFSKALPFKAAMNLFPTQLTIEKEETDPPEQRFVNLSFEPDESAEGKLERVIFVAEDITDKRAAELEKDRLFERVERITKVSNDVENFELFNERVISLYESSLMRLEEYNESDLSLIKRDLHTLKGLLGLYSFKTCASFIHKSEEALGDKDIENALSNAKSARDLFNDQVENIKSVLDLDKAQGSISISKEKLKELGDLINSDSNNKEIIHLFNRLSFLPLKELGNKYSDYINDKIKIAPGKQIEVAINGDLELPVKELRELDSILIHLINNSIIHGIETVSERQESGKDSTGRIEITGRELEDGLYEIVYKDDGRGISAEKIFESALSKGLVSEAERQSLSEMEKVNLIFKSGFSTEENATEISGRGVGMDAIKTMVLENDGSIDLKTEEGKYLNVIIKMPNRMENE